MTVQQFEPKRSASRKMGTFPSHRTRLVPPLVWITSRTDGELVTKIGTFISRNSKSLSQAALKVCAAKLTSAPKSLYPRSPFSLGHFSCSGVLTHNVRKSRGTSHLKKQLSCASLFTWSLKKHVTPLGLRS